MTRAGCHAVRAAAGFTRQRWSARRSVVGCERCLAGPLPFLELSSLHTAGRASNVFYGIHLSRFAAASTPGSACLTTRATGGGRASMQRSTATTATLRASTPAARASTGSTRSSAGCPPLSERARHGPLRALRPHRGHGGGGAGGSPPSLGPRPPPPIIQLELLLRTLPL